MFIMEALQKCRIFLTVTPKQGGIAGYAGGLQREKQKGNEKTETKDV